MQLMPLVYLSGLFKWFILKFKVKSGFLMATITIPVLFGDKEELYSLEITTEEHKRIMNGDNDLLQKLVTEETERRSTSMIQQLVNSNENSETALLEGDNAESHTESHNNDDKEAFNWPEKAVLLFLELYREREHEFTTGLKRHNKLWGEIALELQNLNYNVSAVQVQNKMSSLKRTYKKIKDCNAKSGNHNSSWAHYSIMDSIFGEKSWVSPPAVASSDGPIEPSSLASSSAASICSSSQSSMDNLDQDISSSKPKKRKVETILDSFISDLKNNRDQMKEERKKERLEKEQKKEQRWEVYRTEKKEMHNETTEIQRSLVSILSKLVEK